MNGMFKRMEDCRALGEDFPGFAWIRSERGDGTTELLLPKEKGDGNLQVTVIDETTAFVVTDVCLREKGGLRLSHRKDRLELACCLQGGASLTTRTGKSPIRRGDTIVFTDSGKKQTGAQILEFEAGERFVSAGFLILPGRNSMYLDSFGHGLQRGLLPDALQQLNHDEASPFGIVSIPSLQSALFKAYCETIQNPIAKALFLESSILESVSYLMDWILGEKGKRSPLDEYEYRVLKEVHDRMLEDLAHPPTLSRIAKEVGLNETKLKSGFKEVYGMPVYQYFKRAKMQRAMELLKTTAQSIREIAFQCGYSSQGQFSAAFRGEFGLTPLQARKVVRSDNVGLGQKNAISGDTL